MAKHEPAKIKKALKLVAGGKSKYEAARLAKVAPSSVYRAMQREAEKAG